jgi:hypothetical protein
MLQRTGGGLVHDGCHAGASALGDDHAVGSGTFGGADYGTQIVRVAYLIADDDEGKLAPFLGNGENILDIECGIGEVNVSFK